MRHCESDKWAESSVFGGESGRSADCGQFGIPVKVRIIRRTTQHYANHKFWLHVGNRKPLHPLQYVSKRLKVFTIPFQFTHSNKCSIKRRRRVTQHFSCILNRQTMPHTKVFLPHTTPPPGSRLTRTETRKNGKKTFPFLVLLPILNTFSHT